ncbi:intercellular adhesion molecule 2 [Sorex fumeus]|uniref:intercellular adhesion molecule 2 n=1 Tax=Sorex fumeus TaxID=62283 RepID=UPI0024ACA428|nr:intercellular adhesion molecule 2 [Sorex fumeus]
MRLSPGWGLLAALLILSCHSGSGDEEFGVSVWPVQVAVGPAESWLVNCSTSCPQPEDGGLDTALSKTLQAQGSHWMQYQVANASHDTVVYCRFTCSGQQRSKGLRVTVFHPPKLVHLKLKPSWVAAGRPFTLECRVPVVAPLESLTLTLLHGHQPLHSQTFRKAARGPQEATATHHATARSEDAHRNFSCLAELDLRPVGGSVVLGLSEPQALKVYEPVQDSQLVILIAAVSVLLFLFVAAVLLCFVFGQHWRQQRTGAYGVQAAWRSLRWPSRA